MATQCYPFGPYKIPQSEVFYTTDLSFAFVNLRPVRPGMLVLFRSCLTILSVFKVISANSFFIFHFFR